MITSRSTSVVTALALLFMSVVARATVIVVTNTTDVVNGDTSSPSALLRAPGPDGISLREAILAFDQGGGPSTISFSPALAGATIRLSMPLYITRDGLEVRGFRDPTGQPQVTLDGRGMTIPLAIFFIQASRIKVAELRFTGVTNHGIEVRAGASVYPPTPPDAVADIRIEDNVFDNTGVSAEIPAAIRIWTNPEAISTDALIARVRVARNRFRAYSDVGVLANAFGTRTVITGVEILSNEFAETANPIEIAFNRAVAGAIRGTRIVDNAIDGAINPIFIATLGDMRVSSMGNVIEDTLVQGNRIIGQFESIGVEGGEAAPGGGITQDNHIRKTTIVNNVILTGRGIHITGGAKDSRGNSVEDVRIIGNTIVTQPLAGVRVDVNRDGGIGSTVRGVDVRNTIFWRRNPDQQFPEDEIAGDISTLQVHYSLTSVSGFAGINGNVSGNPLFVDLASGDVRLRSGSPAIDAGTSDDASEIDSACSPRIDDPATPNRGGGAVTYYDIGAFEYGAPIVARLTIIEAGPGAGMVSTIPGGVVCGGSLAYPPNAEVLMLPAVTALSIFRGWQGDPDCLDGRVVMNTDKTCVASFDPIVRTRAVRH
jgi:hypothetical protein